MYIHVPKEKRTKIEPSGKKGTFVSYNETLKAYSIYVPGQRKIEVSRDVAFDEEITFWRSRESHIDIDIGENEASHDAEIPAPDSHCSDTQREELDDPIDTVDPVEPVEPTDSPRDAPLAKRRPTWLR